MPPIMGAGAFIMSEVTGIPYFKIIQAALQEYDILVLGQGIDGSPRQLLQALKSNPRVVLLGTASFWEGVDVAGGGLSVLAIMRLPFNVPTDPVFAPAPACSTAPSMSMPCRRRC
jgi:hypothetical protein